MSTSIAAGVVPADVAAAIGAGPVQPAAPPDPAEANRFASLMAPPPMDAGPAGSVRSVAVAVADQLGGNVRPLEDIRASMLASIDPADPVKTMWAMTELSMEAHTLFTKLHLSTGLASAATSLFGSLLKNQQ